MSNEELKTAYHRALLKFSLFLFIGCIMGVFAFFAYTDFEESGDYTDIEQKLDAEVERMSSLLDRYKNGEWTEPEYEEYRANDFFMKAVEQIRIDQTRRPVVVESPDKESGAPYVFKPSPTVENILRLEIDSSLLDPENISNSVKNNFSYSNSSWPNILLRDFNSDMTKDIITVVPYMYDYAVVALASNNEGYDFYFINHVEKNECEDGNGDFNCFLTVEGTYEQEQKKAVKNVDHPVQYRLNAKNRTYLYFKWMDDHFATSSTMFETYPEKN